MLQQQQSMTHNCYEGVKAGKTIPQIVEEMNDTSGNVFNRVKRIVELCILFRKGKPKSYKYSVADKPYETFLAERRRISLIKCLMIW
ncbi:MAG: hypothetical protein K0Q73_4618 [Paenibacillus sp.]|jgi:hypothetical protein|nr:hypothetical protein [Paenibacillus sp.]